MSTFKERLKNSWNAFLGRDPTFTINDMGPGYSNRPDRVRLTRGNARSIVSSIYNIIATDAASIDIKHIRVNENGQYEEDMKSNLNTVLTRSANIDQTSRSLTKDLIMSMFDEGVVAVVPYLTDENPNYTEGFDIYEMRTAKIVEWFPEDIRVQIYNPNTGQKTERVVSKKWTAIIENPFYAIMNEPNSTLQRLKRILNQIDAVNDKSASSKLDLIIQLPYSTRGNARQAQASERRKQIEAQLTGPLGIAYIDINEKVTQLNRPIANNLWEQAKDLTEQLFNQLGVSKSVFDGTADEQTMLNYYNRTIDPIITAIVEEYERKFLSDIAVARGQAIRAFRPPFRLVPTNNLAEIADKFTRNEILTSNEFRSILGMKPAKDKRADQLINSNINHPDEKQQINNSDENFQNEQYYKEDDE